MSDKDRWLEHGWLEHGWLEHGRLEDGALEDGALESFGRRLVDENRAIEPPPGLIDRIEARLGRATLDGAAPRRLWLVPALAVAAALTLAIAGWFALHRTPTAPTPPESTLALAPIAPPVAPAVAPPVAPLIAPLTPPDTPNDGPAPERLAAAPDVRVRLDQSSPWLARPVASHSPNVTLVLLYRAAVPPPSPPPPQEGNPS